MWVERSLFPQDLSYASPETPAFFLERKTDCLSWWSACSWWCLPLHIFQHILAGPKQSSRLDKWNHREPKISNILWNNLLIMSYISTFCFCFTKIMQFHCTWLWAKEIIQDERQQNYPGWANYFTHTQMDSIFFFFSFLAIFEKTWNLLHVSEPW